MKYDRIEVRLDPEHVRKVSELREKYGTSTSELVREAIDEAYEKMMLERRLAALEQIRAFEDGEEAMPDPEELKRQNEEFYTRSIEESLRRCEDGFESPGTD